MTYKPTHEEGARAAPRLGGLIGRVGRQWRRAVDARLQPFDLTEASWLPLIHLSRAEQPMRQKDLAAALSLDKSSVVRVLKALEEAGLIARGEDAEDHRARALVISARGRKLAAQVESVSQALERELIAEIAPENLAVARDVLERLGADLDRLAEARA